MADRAANPSFRELLANPVHLFAFGFGSGLSPWAPGTAGSLAATAVWLAVFATPLGMLSWAAWLWVGIAVALGVWLCGRSAARLGAGDHPGIVWDEFAGCWIALALVPPGWLWALGGVLVFRVLDVFKPWPIKWLDRNIKGGLGIMLDDIAAGIMAALCMRCAALLG